ncbi:MAG: 50S ribosomal protein L10 [Proteobacteria bacterium]|nr:50S ribosomal protein L10 [Pseudomonadota bacterium]
MKKEIKPIIVQNLKSRYEKATLSILLKNKGLTVAEMTDLRKKMKSVNVEVKVAKNTLSKIAVKETPYSNLTNYFEGPIVTLWAYNDPVVPAKMLSSFLKEQQKAEFVAGAIKEKIISDKDLNVLATLPSREELLAKMLGSLKSPMNGLVNVLAGVPRSFLNVLNAIKEKKSS